MPDVQTGFTVDADFEKKTVVWLNAFEDSRKKGEYFVEGAKYPGNMWRGRNFLER